MRIRMSILATGLLAGALALGSSSVDANQPAPLANFYANSPNSVVIDATPAAAGEMCYIVQAGQLIGGSTLNGGTNVIPVATNGMDPLLIADGPGIMPMASQSFDDLPNEE